MAESLPSSVSAFSHRRTRHDSTSTFVYHEEPDASNDFSNDSAFADRNRSFERRSISDVGDFEFGIEDEEDSADRDYMARHDDFMLRRCSSTQSRSSSHARLLRRDSTATVASGRSEGRSSQKIYMANENLTIAVAGFKTSTMGLAIYLSLCVLTGGVAFLVYRWLPRLYIGTVGRPSLLKDCKWTVIENQWGEVAIHPVRIQKYGRPVSTIFGSPKKPFLHAMDDDDDTPIDHLRSLDYRYVRLHFHPVKDKFILSAGWKDPGWVDVRRVRSGLDTDEKAIRDVIFGSNLIDISQKTVGQLLVDEVTQHVSLG